MKNKIGLIGAGQIGGTIALISAIQNVADVALFDMNGDLAAGKALDIMEGSPANGSKIKVRGSGDPEILRDSNIVIVTAGVPRKPGMTRADLVGINAKVMKSVGKTIKEYAPNAFVICITNPLDVMVGLLQKHSGVDHKKIVGMAGVLDSSRYIYFLSQALKVSASDIKAFVLGGHGDGMVPLLECTTVAGIPLAVIIEKGVLSMEEYKKIVTRTQKGGGEIVSLYKTGSAFYAPAASAILMAKSYLFDERKVIPCAAYLSGEYGVKDIFVGVPTIIGKNGAEKVIELSLKGETADKFAASVASVKALKKEVENI